MKRSKERMILYDEKITVPRDTYNVYTYCNFTGIQKEVERDLSKSVLHSTFKNIQSSHLSLYDIYLLKRRYKHVIKNNTIVITVCDNVLSIWSLFVYTTLQHRIKSYLSLKRKVTELWLNDNRDITDKVLIRHLSMTSQVTFSSLNGREMSVTIQSTFSEH
jgi:hypothetical protein